MDKKLNTYIERKVYMNDTLKTIIKIVAVIAIIWIAIPLISFAFQLVIVVLGVFLVYRGIKKLINKTKELVYRLDDV